jgi:hypothetical protein
VFRILQSAATGRTLARMIDWPIARLVVGALCLAAVFVAALFGAWGLATAAAACMVGVGLWATAPRVRDPDDAFPLHAVLRRHPPLPPVPGQYRAPDPRAPAPPLAALRLPEDDVGRRAGRG